MESPCGLWVIALYFAGALLYSAHISSFQYLISTCTCKLNKRNISNEAVIIFNFDQESTECVSMKFGMQRSGIMIQPWRSVRVKETQNSKIRQNSKIS